MNIGIGDRIRVAREAAHLSKSELARRLGLHPSACVQWEAKGGTRPNVEHLAKVAAILNVRFEWLATGRGEQYYAPGIQDESPQYGGLDSLLHSDERHLLETYRRMLPRQRKALLELLGVVEAAKDAEVPVQPAQTSP